MLTGITLENFKAFKEPQFIPIKPITLVFGQNNAGKSSIIHALAFLKHVHRTNGDCNPGRMNYGWSNLDLGPWGELVFGQDKDTCMIIKLHTKTTAIQWRFENSPSGPKVGAFEIEENGIVTAQGENIGTKGILWKVELHPSHWLWAEYKAALWKRFIERFERTQAIGESTKSSAHDRGTLRQDEFEHHFNLWLGETWKAPPIGCHPAYADTSDIPFEGLFPRQALPSRIFDKPKGSKENASTYYDSERYGKNFTDEVFDKLLQSSSDGSLTIQESEKFFGDLYAGGELKPINDALHVDGLLSSFVSHLHLDAQRFPPEGILSKNRLSSNKSEHQPWLKLLDQNPDHQFNSEFRSNIDYHLTQWASISDELVAELESAHKNRKLAEKWPSLSQDLADAGISDSNIKIFFREARDLESTKSITLSQLFQAAWSSIYVSMAESMRLSALASCELSDVQPPPTTLSMGRRSRA